jgi:hypothetical protein
METRMTTVENKLAAMGAALDGGNAPMPIVPADLLNLDNWKWTLPVLDPISGRAEEILQPELANFSDHAFCANPDGPGVRCRVYHGDKGVTKTSLNPRSEGREMLGALLAAWNPTSGTHLLSVSTSVTHQTTVKPHNVLGQIHDGASDVCTFRLEGTTLYRSNGNTAHDATITKGYVLGDKLNLSFLVSAGKIRTFFNGAAAGVPDLSVPSGASGWYFRAGNYLQSNPTTAPTESPDAYSDVVLFDVAVFHA